MTGAIEISKRLVLQYGGENPGQFSTGMFRANATDRELLDLAMQINSVQSDPVSRVLTTRTIQFM